MRIPVCNHGELHNMSTPPTTPAHGAVRGRHGPRLEFALDLLGPSPLWDGAGRDATSRAHAVAARAAELLPELDAAWERLALRGAAILWNAPSDIDERALRAIDPLVAINVLARAQGEILIARAPACLDPARLARALETDDPRLVAAGLAPHTEGDRS